MNEWMNKNNNNIIRITLHYVSKLKNDHLNLISILTIYSAFLSKTNKKKENTWFVFYFQK